jgi:hypothetical protein
MDASPTTPPDLEPSRSRSCSNPRERSRADSWRRSTRPPSPLPGPGPPALRALRGPTEPVQLASRGASVQGASPVDDAQGRFRIGEASLEHLRARVPGRGSSPVRLVRATEDLLPGGLPGRARPVQGRRRGRWRVRSGSSCASSKRAPNVRCRALPFEGTLLVDDREIRFPSGLWRCGGGGLRAGAPVRCEGARLLDAGVRVRVDGYAPAATPARSGTPPTPFSRSNGGARDPDGHGARRRFRGRGARGARASLRRSPGAGDRGGRPGRRLLDPPTFPRGSTSRRSCSSAPRTASA